MLLLLLLASTISISCFYSAPKVMLQEASPPVFELPPSPVLKKVGIRRSIMILVVVSGKIAGGI